MLVALVGDEVRAAVSVGGGEAIADPFHPTAEIVRLLTARAEQMRPGAAHRPRGGLRRSARRRAPAPGPGASAGRHAARLRVAPLAQAGWRTTSLRAAAASSSRRTGVV